MSKITGKFQITLPKRLVDQYGFKVGDDVELIAAGEGVCILPAHRGGTAMSPDEKLRHFDLATRRQRARERARPLPTAKHRGWTREDLYTRGRTR